MKKKKYNKIIKEAGEVGQTFKGFEHRNHRTKSKKTGPKRTMNPKKAKLKKQKEREINNQINKLYEHRNEDKI